MKTKILLIATAVVLFASCKKEDSSPSGNQGSGNVLDNGVMILNEGLFSRNNASITLFNNEDEKSDAIFQSVNDKALGDVLQSVTETESAYYLVVNNSEKIEVVNKNTFVSIATIEGFLSPRYLLDLENGKALVTNLVNADSAEVEINIDVVNLSTNKIESNIKVKNSCEMMHLNDETIYVANTGKNQILLIDKNTLSVTGHIATPESPTQIFEDKNGKLWVLCIGKSWEGIPAAVIAINPTSNTIEKQIDFKTGAFPTKIALNGGGGILFILTDKLYTTSVNDATSSLSMIPNVNGFENAYGLGIDPVNTEIYIGDAKDFVSKGNVKVYDIDGNLLKTFQTGVNPNGFVFR